MFTFVTISIKFRVSTCNTKVQRNLYSVHASIKFAVNKNFYNPKKLERKVYEIRQSKT